MNQMTRAVLVLNGDTDEEKPLMLESILFCPLLTWVGEALMSRSIRRFFILCPDSWQAEARAFLPAGAEAVISADSSDLIEFLREDGPVAVLPDAMIPEALPGGSSCAYTVQASALAERFAAGRDGMPDPDSDILPGFTRVDNRVHLQERELECRDVIVRRHRANGVHVLDEKSIYIDPRTQIGAGSMILPGTILRGHTRIGRGCEIGPNTMIRDCTVGDASTVNSSQLNESTIGCRTNVGPFAYVRPGCTVGDDIKVGDFVELKNSVIGDGTKISHLTYVGDSDVGEHVNFGCGTVTTNYDGFKKYRTTVGDHVFIGCNTNLVAPVRVGNGAYIAAGATITEDVPPDALAIARSRQTVKDGWAERNRKKHAGT